MAFRRLKNNGNIVLKKGSVSRGITGAVTIVSVCRPTTSNTNTFWSWDVSNGYFFQRTGAQKLILQSKSGNFQEVTLGGSPVENNVFGLFAVTKAAGTSAPRFHYYNFNTKQWTHQNAGGTLVDASESTSENSRMSSGGLAVTDYAALAVWAKAMTDEELEALVDVAVFEEWKSLSPGLFVTLGQQETGQTVKDWAGNGANQESISENEVKAESPPIPYSAREQVTWLITTHSLKAASKPAEFDQLPWAVQEGQWNETVGWAAADYSAGLTSQSGIYWNTEEIDNQGNGAVSVVYKNATLLSGRSAGAWLFSQVGEQPSGYQFEVFQTGSEASKMTVKLRKWIGGVETLLGEATNVTLEEGGSFAVAARGGTVFGLIKKSSTAEWEVVVEAADSTFKGGYSGVDANGANGRLTEFATATIEGPPVGEGAVKVLIGGELVDAKRWVLVGGELVAA